MIPAQPGWFAFYKSFGEDADKFFLEIQAWNDNGIPMVVDSEKGRLVLAGDLSTGEYISLIWRNDNGH